MQRLVTLVANGDVTLQDISGLEANNRDNQWMYTGTKSGTTVQFKVTEGQWDRVRAQLIYASQQRIPQAANFTKTQPLCTYQVELLPGARPRVHSLTDGLAAAAATGSITAVGGASLVDGETFTISDGSHSATVFEFDSGGGVTGGHVAVSFTGGDSAATVAAAIRAAINGVVGGLTVTAAAPVGAVVGLTNDGTGDVGNVAITETVANAGFLVSGMSGGQDVTSGHFDLKAAVVSPLLVHGTGLIPGLQSGLTINAGTTSSLAFTATSKGPVGDQVVVNILAASGGGSVTTKLGVDGAVTVTIVPAAGSSNANAIATQLNASTMGAKYVTAVGGGAGVVYPVLNLRLSGGDGCGVARLDIPGSATNSGLRVLAVKPGNDQNLITLTLVMSQISNTVSVSGNNITVNRTGATETIANLVTAINGNASAAALVTASTLEAAGSIGAVAKSYLYGGAAETPVVTVGGAVATITACSDTQLSATVLGSALVTAGLAVGDFAQVVMLTNYGVVKCGQSTIVDTT